MSGLLPCKKAKNLQDCQILSRCKKCASSLSYSGWCQICAKNRRFEHNFDKWTSGNSDIDHFIRSKQISAQNENDVVEWIPFEEFTQLQEIGQSGLYKANWKRWARFTIALKTVGTTEDLLNEAKLMNDFKLDLYHLYGMTRDPSNGKYLLVLSFTSLKDLRHYIRTQFANITWQQRIEILYYFCQYLNMIHSKGIVHADLSSIPMDDGMTNCCEMRTSISKSLGQIKRFGVLPYEPPEVLKGGAHSKESDIYSLAMIMCELCSGKPPFGKRPFDVHLALDVCDGLRPELAEGIPTFYQELLTLCWNQDPTQRPSSQEIETIVYNWRVCPTSEIENQLHSAEEFRSMNASKYDPEESYKTHPLAIYTSRVLPNLKAETSLLKNKVTLINDISKEIDEKPIPPKSSDTDIEVQDEGTNKENETALGQPSNKDFIRFLEMNPQYLSDGSNNIPSLEELDSKSWVFKEQPIDTDDEDMLREWEIDVGIPVDDVDDEDLLRDLEIDVGIPINEPNDIEYS